MTSARGTLAYMAPEILTKDAFKGESGESNYTQAVDTFAFGLHAHYVNEFRPRI